MSDNIETELTINPDPQILHVLTYLEMRPIDSLCELIDNAIDSFGTESSGTGVVTVELPSRREVDDGRGFIRVRDNGPGMTLEQLENSLKAGYSSKRQKGTLGLFGVGFNIATGKLGRITKLISARKEDDYAIETVVDLVSLRRSGNFKVNARKVPKGTSLEHGTVVQIGSPWDERSQNYNFMLKLVSLGHPKILSLLGRIYATPIREKRVKIIVGEDVVEAYHHCIWDDSRSVEHSKHGKIPAIFRFSNVVIYTSVKCASCGLAIPEGQSRCPDGSCGSASLVTEQEKISGWVGIQRYLDASHFGIDLIRNGRTIRILEKQAFFEYQYPDSSDPIVDYPIDDRQGRIVGEVHLNHVPVDPAKQNFERSSPEWRRAIEYLRGASSLQPTQPGADKNESPIFRLYQGYRKVRLPGLRSMTVGKWLPGASQATALSRPDIDHLKELFDRREPGYFDDKEWWKLVEEAEQRPLEGLRKCPECFLEAPEGLNDCPHCGHIFNGKTCINKDCGSLIPMEAVSCPTCGANQVPEILLPWVCAACGATNPDHETRCHRCGSHRGAPNPLSRSALESTSHFVDELSITGMSVRLANGSMTSPIDLKVYFSDKEIRGFRQDGSSVRLPSVRLIENAIYLFLDKSHPFFSQAKAKDFEQVSFEVAAYIYDYHRALTVGFAAEHSVTKIAVDVAAKYWPDKFSMNRGDQDFQVLLSTIRSRLAETLAGDSKEAYSDLPNDDKTEMAKSLMRAGRDFAEISDLASSGQFVQFVPARALLNLLSTSPEFFFDGRVWKDSYNTILEVDPLGGEQLQRQLRSEYTRLFDLALSLVEKRSNHPLEDEIIRAACELLTAKLAG